MLTDAQKCLRRRRRRRRGRQTKKPTMRRNAISRGSKGQPISYPPQLQTADPRRSTAHVPDEFFISFDDLRGFRVTDRRHWFYENHASSGREQLKNVTWTEIFKFL